MRLLYLAAAFLVSGAVVHACDNVSALSGSCYSQNLVERQVEPVYVERIVVPQKIVRERIVKRIVEKQRAPRLERLRSLQLRGRNNVVRRERIVERSY